jgi:hypothetical protein
LVCPLPGVRRFLAGRDLVELAVWPSPPGHPGSVAEEGDGAEHFRLCAGWYGLDVLVLSARHERHEVMRAFRFMAEVPANDHVVDGLLAGIHDVGDDLIDHRE